MTPIDVTRMVVIMTLLRMLLHVPVAVTAAASKPTATTTTNASKATPQSKKFPTIEQLQKVIETYRLYPQRHREEAAVIEWGHSAIISAIDASVAYFGPQTSDAAVFEVETSPLLADPIDGVTYTNPETKEGAKTVSVLTNANEIHGNVAVMTDVATMSSSTDVDGQSSKGPSLLSCLDLAIIAQNSKAAALMIVHINEDRPDDAPRCTIPKGREQEAASIDIPIVTISLASIDVFTSATVTEDTKPEDVVNHGMPERIRLYAGGERPFFEDIETIEPTVYMIHNLLTLSECNTMIEQANQQTFQPVISNQLSNPLIEYMTDTRPYQNVDRTVLHPGFFQSLVMKAIDERIEQVTGFPINHYSEWIIDRMTVNSTYHPHYDNTLVPNDLIPHATITVFLNDLSEYADSVEGGQLVYPTISGKTTKNVNGNTNPIQIQSTQGLGVVHHNINEKQHLETYSLHALLPITFKTQESSSSSSTVPYLYIAKKYMLPVPISKVRRYAIPIYLLLFGRHGRTPVTNLLSDCYIAGIRQLGVDRGNMYFDYLIVGVPTLILVMLLSLLGYQLYRHWMLVRAAVMIPTSTSTTGSATTATAVPKPPVAHHKRASHKAPATKKKN